MSQYDRSGRSWNKVRKKEKRAESGAAAFEDFPATPLADSSKERVLARRLMKKAIRADDQAREPEQ
ncbi:MAG: hypothetical protein ACXW1R_08275 [Halobacteriota archaeon]